MHNDVALKLFQRGYRRLALEWSYFPSKNQILVRSFAVGGLRDLLWCKYREV